MSRENFIPCPECGQVFENIFDAVDHTLEDDEEFDPALVLPNGYRLMIGSLLRAFYHHANDKDFVEKITQDTYMTLFMAEVSPNAMASLVHDVIVENSMADIDEELKELFENGDE